jgi:hypothetical protein
MAVAFVYEDNAGTLATDVVDATAVDDDNDDLIIINLAKQK